MTEAEIHERVVNRDRLTITVQCAGLAFGKASPATITILTTREVYEGAKSGHPVCTARFANALVAALVKLEGASETIQL